ncbi:MAG: hypothetical protein NVSMB1_03050 [Polyangiales bacterium]
MEVDGAEGVDETGKAAFAALREQLVAVAEPIVAAQQCELVSLDYRREVQGWVLRLYVERLGHDPRLAVGGVVLAQCVTISRDLGTALEVAELIAHAYHLEVSSPGLDRPLVRPADYRRFVGLRAKVQLSTPVADWPNRKVFRGELTESPNDDQVCLMEDDLGAVTLPFAQVLKANLVYQPPGQAKPGKAKPGHGGRARKLNRENNSSHNPKRTRTAGSQARRP